MILRKGKNFGFKSNPNNIFFIQQSAMSLLADIYLKTNDWANATHAADIVLERGKSHNKVTGHSIPRLFNPQFQP